MIFMIFNDIHVVVFQGQPTNSMGLELLFIFEDSSKLHGHTNEHVQLEGAHQDINRSLLPCRHTSQVDMYLGHASIKLFEPCLTQCVAKSVIIEAWTFGYVQLLTHSPGIASYS